MSRKIGLTFFAVLVTVVTILSLVLTGSDASAASTTDLDSTGTAQNAITYPVVDTGQGQCYDNDVVVACPDEGAAFYGQDAQYSGAQPSYTDNGDGTVTDNVTGLMWQQSPDMNGDGAITAADKLTYGAAVAGAESFSLGGYTDWRLPTIKELYSLILFDGTDPSAPAGTTVSLTPFIDTRAFDFAYGDAAAGERTIDAQFASSTVYVGSTDRQTLVFGVNFADGRIKGYGLTMPDQSQGKTFFVLYVRGSSTYGVNAFVANGDGTITDQATGLMWQQDDNGAGVDWEEALATCDALNTADYDDWRLPNAKELQSIVDYTRAPASTGSAAIDPLFNATAITNELGQTDYPYYWTSTTHANLMGGSSAVYVSFGRALGYMQNGWTDVHGAGAQRSDPKTGDPTAWPTGHGPQGDAIRIDNAVRCVRGGNVTLNASGGPSVTRPGITVTVTQIMMDANQGANGPQAQGGETPPQAAIEACSGISQGTACQVTAPQGTITGRCMPAGGQLACVPAGGPPTRND